MSNPFGTLQEWYVAQCNGEWEHGHGIKISTIDNPGWSLKIDLEGTLQETKSFTSVDLTRDESDWIRCRIREGRFEGFGGPKNLEELVGLFLQWARAD